MKKRQMFHIGIFIIVLLTSFNVFSVSSIRPISGNINDSMRIILNNREFDPKNIDGTSQKPIIYKDRTYVPVRALSEKMGFDVNWDGESNLINIKEKKKFNWMEASYIGYDRQLTPGVNWTAPNALSSIMLNEIPNGRKWSYEISDPSVLKFYSRQYFGAHEFTLRPTPIPTPIEAKDMVSGPANYFIFNFQGVKSGVTKLTVFLTRDTDPDPAFDAFKLEYEIHVE